MYVFEVLLRRTCSTGKQQLWVLRTVLMLAAFFWLPSIFLRIIHSSHPRYPIHSSSSHLRSYR
ncbi:unnamed protein product [Ilex paraguariensis]|uniref:Uncharacterized protein n=1 Tax=Ilex paraguariensis TaxID=185542 RepID=A0ABC8U5D2_9AQUA